MSKYRIIKSVAADKDKPYFPQYWNTKQDRWANFQTLSSRWGSRDDLSYKTLREAKKYIRDRQEEDERAATPAEVVWEDIDE